MENDEIDYKLAVEQFHTDKHLFGENGASALLGERILNASHKDEMDAHLSKENHESGNRRNVKMAKTVQT